MAMTWAHWPLLLLLALCLEGCALLERHPVGRGLPGLDQQQPSLSGDGRYLAFIRGRGSSSSVELLDLASGRRLPLPPLRRGQPHGSPSLSWNGRYLGLLLQRWGRRRVAVLDRASGTLEILSLPRHGIAQQLSLAPDGRTLAVQMKRSGQWDVELFDLGSTVEPDAPGGLLRTGPPSTGGRS